VVSKANLHLHSREREKRNIWGNTLETTSCPRRKKIKKGGGASRHQEEKRGGGKSTRRRKSQGLFLEKLSELPTQRRKEKRIDEKFKKKKGKKRKGGSRTNYSKGRK